MGHEKTALKAKNQISKNASRIFSPFSLLIHIIEMFHANNRPALQKR